MISLKDVHLRFGNRPILQGVDLNVRDGECIAVVGPNGCGKTTLLKVIAGLENPNRGEVLLPSRATVGYLPQQADLNVKHSLREELLDAFAEVRSALHEMKNLEERMGKTTPGSAEHDRILRRYNECSQLVDFHDGYALEAQVRRVATGLGFSESDLERSCREFSGGWQMRILLAKLLLRRPDILLLDEPTNHLDLESTLWLEDWIKRCGRTVALVSHERATMDRLAERILCLEQGTADVYPGDYSKYLDQSCQKREAAWAAYERQQKEIAAIEAFIRRFRYNARRASLVQSRIKQLEKIERLEPPFHPTAIHFDFPAAAESYRDVVVLKDLGHAYGDHRVFTDLNLTIRRGEKIGLVGVNGAGKSTLLRIVAGLEKPTKGECILGGKVECAYFAQYDAATLDSDTALLQAIQQTAPLGQGHRARDLLGAFLFSGDDVEKPLRVLSGGERTRFRLANMLFSPANLLLLDEPTNHLDVTSRATVEEALRKYSGTLVVVSHDRVFMDRVTNRIMEIENGALRTYPGSYTDYLADKERIFSGESGVGPEQSVSIPMAVPEASKQQRIREREGRKAYSRRRESLERKIEALERKTGETEARLAELDAAMSASEVASDYARLVSLTEERRRLAETHHRLIDEWDTLHTELDQMGELS